MNHVKSANKHTPVPTNRFRTENYLKKLVVNRDEQLKRNTSNKAKVEEKRKSPPNKQISISPSSAPRSSTPRSSTPSSSKPPSSKQETPSISEFWSDQEFIGFLKSVAWFWTSDNDDKAIERLGPYKTLYKNLASLRSQFQEFKYKKEQPQTALDTESDSDMDMDDYQTGMFIIIRYIIL